MKSDPSLCRYAKKTGIVTLIFVLSFSINTFTITSDHVVEASGVNATSTTAVLPEEDGFTKQELLWFARAVYSETKVPDEQRLIAWVIRNRVESGKYADTYMGVVLQPKQFSGLNATDRHYHTNTTLVPGDIVDGWESAQATAREVYYADSADRPIAETTWHFYSPISVRRTPAWAQDEHPVQQVHDPVTQAVRFAFYANIK